MSSPRTKTKLHPEGVPDASVKILGPYVDSGHNAPGAPQTFPRFFDLPAELRREIYSYLYNPERLRIRRRAQRSDLSMYRAPLSNMICTSRQFRNEYLDALLPRAELRLSAVENLDEYDTFMMRAPPCVYERLQTYHFSLNWGSWVKKASGARAVEGMSYETLALSSSKRLSHAVLGSGSCPLMVHTTAFKRYLTKIIDDLCGTGPRSGSQPPRLPALREITVALHVTAAAIGMPLTSAETITYSEYLLTTSSLLELESVSTSNVRVHVKMILNIPFALQDQSSRWGTWHVRNNNAARGGPNAADMPGDAISCWELMPTTDDNNLRGFFPRYTGTYLGRLYRPVADAALVEHLCETGRLRREDIEKHPSNRYRV